MFRIGVDLGGTNIDIGLVDDEHRIVCRTSRPTPAAGGTAAVVADIADGIRLLCSQHGLAPEEAAALGVGTPGICDAETGTVYHAHNLGWEGVPLGAMLRERFPLPVFIGNDADCAALGESVAGAAKGCSSALLVTLGTGVGGGLVIDGKVYAGHRMRGGEFGHMCIQAGGERCSCGQRGCWEAYACAGALIRQGKAAAAAHPESALYAVKDLDGETVFAAAAAGDETAKAVTAQYTAYLGIGLTNLINALCPEVVLIGGGIAEAGEALLSPLRAYVEAHHFLRGAAPAPVIRRAALGRDAGIVGAAALAVRTPDRQAPPR